jgi:hypothetical protein
MKTHTFLGILWMVVCSVSAIKWLLFLTLVVPKLPHPVGPLGICIYLFFCLLYLTGVVVSYFLFQGVQWARTFLGFIAGWGFIACVAQIVAFKTVSLWGGISGVFFLVSLLVLFAPRHDPAA